MVSNSGARIQTHEGRGRDCLCQLYIGPGAQGPVSFPHCLELCSKSTTDRALALLNLKLLSTLQILLSRITHSDDLIPFIPQGQKQMPPQKT